MVTPSTLPLKPIEGLLLSQDGVVDASVWQSNGSVLASVTLDDRADYDPGQLRDLCAFAFGVERAPRLVMIQRALRTAA